MQSILQKWDVCIPANCHAKKKSHKTPGLFEQNGVRDTEDLSSWHYIGPLAQLSIAIVYQYALRQLV